jgi:predicted GNAT family N-acyltransferase
VANLRLVEDCPTPIEYAELRRRMGWGNIDQDTARKSVENSIYSVCLRDGNRLVGLARIVGDGVLYFYLADVILLQELRGGGHGEALMSAVLSYLAKAAKPGATIAVLPLKGRERFYQRFGFRCCPDDLLGPGLYLPDPRVLHEQV